MILRHLKQYNILKNNILYYIGAIAVLFCALLVAGCTSDEELDSTLVIDISAADTTLYPRTNGLLSGLFDVGNETYVRFSQGNLQYKASTNEWRLAPNQYDCVGRRNNLISATCNRWVDLFAWGTSGCDSNLPAYYYAYSGGNNISLNPDMLSPINLYDWGAYIAIPNAGDTSGWLQTLTSSQWYYLLNQRYLAREKRGVAQIEGVIGYMLLPDSWVMPEGATFVPDTALSTDIDTNSLHHEPFVNVYTKQMWQKLECEGAVFLPYCGMRKGRNIIGTDQLGYYWSISHENIMQGMCKYARINEKITANANWQTGMAIRLVHIEK